MGCLVEIFRWICIIIIVTLLINAFSNSKGFVYGISKECGNIYNQIKTGFNDNFEEKDQNIIQIDSIPIQKQIK